MKVDGRVVHSTKFQDRSMTMRLWHEALISNLPRAQLLGQHRECCALRGNGWLKKHSTVDYVFTYHPILLYRYHILIMDEMMHRKYNVNVNWHDLCYRGQRCLPWSGEEMKWDYKIQNPIFKEHDDAYLEECLENLRGKGIAI